MQANSRAGWAYDQEKWTTLNDRSQRYERDLDLEAEMKKMTYDDQKRLQDTVQTSWHKEQQKKEQKRETWTSSKDSPNTNPYKGKDKGGIRSTKAHFTKSWDTDQSHVKREAQPKGGKPKGGKKGDSKKSSVKEEW